MDSAWFRSTFLRVFKFLQIKEEGSNFWGKPILQKVWIICSPHLYFNFKSFIDQNFLSFIRFQWILHDSGVLFPDSSNFYKLKRGGPNFVGCLNYFFFKLFGPPFCFSILKYERNEILRHSLDFNAFFMIQETLSQTFEIFTN